jgi:hypothetical protein
MAAIDLLARGGLPLDDVERLEQRLEPGPRLDVRLRGMELRERRMTYEVDLTASAGSSSEAGPGARPTSSRDTDRS